MVYFKVSVFIITALGLLIYTILLDRKHILKVLTVEVLCSGILAFYIFYYVGCYTSTDIDAELSADAAISQDSTCLVDVVIKWRGNSETFGFNGDRDLLAVRYNPKKIEIVYADRHYREAKPGSKLLNLDKEFQYSKMGIEEKEIGFDVTDCTDDTIKLTVKILDTGGIINYFFIHDYKVPLDSPVYWEKFGSLRLE